MDEINFLTTSQIAKLVGVHPNTIRKYEELGFIPKPLRKANGYRVFSDMHIDHFRLARTAFQIEVLQSGLRKIIIEVIKTSAQGDYAQAIRLCDQYRRIIETEIANAHEAVIITNNLLLNSFQESSNVLKRKEVSKRLGITMDTLRNWEMNGLIAIKRKENGYRVYDDEAINKLKIIRSLRCANYSLTSILRMMNKLIHSDPIDIHQVLNTPEPNEEIVSICDQLIISLNSAKENVDSLKVKLIEMKNKY